jgi:hypothetical protein
VQLSSFATCAASNRAGKSFAAHVVIAACVSSSVIRQSHQGIGFLQAIPSGPPPARALRARAGGQALGDMPEELQEALEDYIPKCLPKGRVVYRLFDVFDIEEKRL